METHEDSGDQTIFIIQKVLRATGGPAPVFLYEGYIERDQENIQDLCSERRLHLADVGKKATCYISYDVASPKCERTLNFAPYRFSFSESDGTALIAGSQLPLHILIDRSRLTAFWSPRLRLAFQSSDDLQQFVDCLRNVSICYTTHDTNVLRCACETTRACSDDDEASDSVVPYYSPMVRHVNTWR